MRAIVKDTGRVRFAFGGLALGLSLLASILYSGVRTAHTAGDTDGDGCMDAAEQQTAVGSETSGGRRDYLNHWDWFNPEKTNTPHTQTIADILAVVQHFGQDSGNPGYSVDYDRTYLGPNRWNLGPPSGKIRVDDILMAINQFGHNCLPAKLTYAHSWYISYPDATSMQNLGGFDGGRTGDSCRDDLVVLDFGVPDHQSGQYGTKDYFGGVFVSDLAVINAAASYAHGWYLATGGCPSLKLVVGTNNSYPQIPSGGGTPYGAGQAWPSVARAVQNYLASSSCSQPFNSGGCAGQITAWAGDDMEQPDELATDPPPNNNQVWDCAGPTKSFVDGYNSVLPPANPSVSGIVLLDYGTAWVPHPCWTEDDVYYVAFNPTPAPWDWPLPEIYSGDASESWKSVRHDHSMYFYGVMTECPQADTLPTANCTTVYGQQFAPNGAQFDFYRRLALDGTGQDLPYLTNIQYQPTPTP